MKLQQQIRFAFLFLALLSLSLPKSLAQAEVTVMLYDGSESSFSISEDGRLYFEDDMLMIDVGNSFMPESIPMASIRKVLLEDKQNTALDNVESDKPVLYPIPCKDELFIRHISTDNIMVEVYSLTGKLLIKQEVAGGRIDVSGLEAGIYLIKIDGNTQKFYKL